MVANISRAIERELASAREKLSRGEVDSAYTHMQTGLDMASEAYSLQHGNIVMTAVLEAQKRQCANKGIGLNAKVVLPAELGIPDIELATMIFSLIDFARENCEALSNRVGQEPVIHIRMLTDLGQLVVDVEGPIVKKLVARRRGDQTLYANGSIAVVREMTERYGGIMDFDDHGKTCRVSVMIPIGKGLAAQLQVIE